MSDWASRRVCKFILKRVLGRFIKGDLDLDRLQIGLGSGTSTIQLNDLALNTHYLNQQLGAATFSVKEGSISSLVIKLPWKQRLDKCQIELDELELVLAPQSEGKTSGCTEACSTVEVDSRKSLQPSEHHLKCSRAHDKGLFTYPGIRDGVQMIANQVESLLLGLHVKIKNLVIAFEPCTKNCGMKVGFESSSQSQTILVLRVSELEYGAVGSGDSCDNTHAYPDDATDLAMLSRLIRFHGAKVDLYDVSDNDGERDKLKHTASILTGKVAGSEPCDNSVPFIHGDEGGFAGSVELSIPWKSGSIDIPRVDAEIYFDPVKLRLELGTIERLIFLLHSLWGDRGTGSEPAIDSKHRKPLGQMMCLGHDEDGGYGFQRESMINEGIFSSQTESFSNIPASTTGGSENFTLISDSMFISNWMQRDDLEDSVDEFFECFDGTRSCQESHANRSLLGLTYSVFSALTAASTLCTGSTLSNSRDQQVEFNIKARLGGFCVIFVFEDLDHSDLVDSNCSSTVKHRTIKGLDNSRVSPIPNNAAGLSSFVQNSQVECLRQDPRSWDTGNAFLEANFQDLRFNIQVSSEEVRFKSGMKCIEIFEYILDDSEKVTSSSLSNCEEHAQGNRSSISCLQSAVEDVLPSFPLSLHIPYAVNDIAKMKTEESICSPSKKFVKVQLFVSDSDSDHQLSLVYQFAAPNSTDSRSFTNFDVQLQPFILWVDFYMAKRIWHLMQVIENLRSVLNKNSNEKTDCHSSAGSKDVPKGNINGTVFVSSSRFILCFPKEGSNSTCPLLAEDLLCFDLSDCGNVNKCHRERLLKNERIFNNCCLSFSSSVNLSVGECNVFLVSPTLKNDVAWSHCYVDGHPLHARKVFRTCNQDENDFSNIGVHWQDAPAMQPRIAEAALKLVKKHWERGSESTEAIGNKLEFIRATTAGAVEDSGSHLREQMRQSSDLCFFFSLPYVQLDLYSSDHILIFNLLHDLLDYMFLEGNARTAFHSEADYNKGTLSLTNKGFDSKESQLTFVFECNVVDIVVHLEESLETKASMKSELPGLWTDISLRVHKFAIMSVSNLGGISGASYFWLTHDEGLLHGTLNERMEKSSESNQKFCLLCCKTDVLGRGDGEGSNALATGNAGTTIIHVSHPQQFQSLTTIMIRCSTLVAPGGRLDWLAAVIAFFNQSSNDDHQIAETSGREGLSEGGGPNGSSFATSFLLELMDVAVIYEPFPRVPTLSNSRTGVTPYPCTLVNPSEETCSPVACILAAASVRLSIQRKPSSVNKVYTILFQDVGLLVLDLLKQRNKKQAYDAKSLRSRGYVKIGEEASMEVVVKMNCQDGLPWEVTCKEYHILLKTCHDTTEALMRLVGQLQQLFAPDFEESFVHLQTRSTNGKVSSFKVNSDFFEDTSQVYRSNTLNSAMEDVDPCHSCEAALAGLMDGILEDAFSPGADFKAVVENGAFLGSKCKGKPHFFFSGPMLEEGCSKDGTSSTSILNVDSGVLDALSFEPKSGIQVGNMHVSCPEKNNFSLIEDYYYPEYFTGSQRCQGKQIKFGQLVSPGKAVSIVTTDFADLQAGWYEDSTVRVFENHISEVNCQNSGQQGKEDNLRNDMGTTISACKNSQSAGQIVLKNFSIKWRMIAGSDWPALTKCVSLPVNGESSRNESSCLELELHGVNFQYDMFPDGGLYASKLAISIRDLLILDQSINAPWKKVLLDYHSKLHPRESSAKALQLTLEAVKPDPATPLEEYRFLVKLHPLRLHLDQSQLEFMINFFSQSASSSPLQGDPSSHASCSRSVGVNDNNWKNMCSTKDALLPFFQKCEIRSLTIHVDYVPRRVNIGALQGGNYAELLNLISWKDIDLHLKHIQTAGVYGWAHLSDIVIDEWLEDITQNQVHKLFRGAAPIRALYAVCSGAAKLVSIPAEHYKKDRRFLKGVRKGLKAFLRSISLEALSCGVHLASGAHGILIHTESALDSIPPSFSRTSIENSEASGKCNQPADVRQGLAQACERLTHGLERTTTSLISNPIKSYNRGDGAGTAIATAFRATPAAVVAPVSAAAGAVHRVLLGVRNGLDPEKKKESEEKYSAPLPTLILLD